LGWIAVQRGNFSDAVTLCCRALEVKPSSAEVYIDMGSAMLGLGQAQAAVECLDAALHIDAHSAQAPQQPGTGPQDAGTCRRCTGEYQQALALDPAYGDAWLNLGVVQRQLDQHGAALESYAQAIALQPDYAKAYVNRGTVLHDLGSLDEAIAAFDQALAIQPNLGEAAWNKSLALLTLGDYDAAWPLYEWRSGKPQRNTTTDRCRHAAMGRHRSAGRQAHSGSG
jgi:tetratricopeptide (TPR) repeat protein